MRLIHTSDWHLGKNLEGISRIKEQEEFLQDFVRIVEEQQADCVIIAGDIYDTVNPMAKAETMFYDTLKQLSKHGERLILVIAGNHDSPERLVAAGPLAMEHGIIMAGTPRTIITPGNYGKHKVLESTEGYIKIEINDEIADVLLIPYPSEKRLNEVIYEEMSEDEENKISYEERMKQLFDTLSSHYEEGNIHLLISHLFVMGSEEAGSERSIQLGGSYLISSEIFPNEAQYIALGHVHKPQVVPGSMKKARYSGSPIAYSRNEINFDKKLWMVDVHAGEEAKITEIALKNYKPIEVWKCNSLEEAYEKCEANKDRECYVYLEITTQEYIREDEIKRLKETKKDILRIQPVMEAEDTETSTLKRREKDFDELFRDFYRYANGVDVTEETMQVLYEVLASDEEESNEANSIKNQRIK